MIGVFRQNKYTKSYHLRKILVQLVLSLYFFNYKFVLTHFVLVGDQQHYGSVKASAVKSQRTSHPPVVVNISATVLYVWCRVLEIVYHWLWIFK